MKVGIVGCGIIGSYLAYRLAGKGVDVTVFDRKAVIGGKACSGLISERLWEHIPRNEQLVENVISHVKIHFSGKIVSLLFKPKMLAVKRDALDRYVVELARKKGANIQIGKNVVDVDNEGMIYTNKKHKFDYVVGCDGALSVVRKIFGKKDVRYRMGIYCYKKQTNNNDFVDTWPTDEGFRWKIPRGKEVEYGVIDVPENVKKEYERLKTQFGLGSRKVMSALIPEGLVLTKNPKVVLCGDAAGLTKPWSGGGVIWGMTAVDILVDSFPDLVLYERRLKSFFSSKIKTSHFARGLITMGVEKIIPKKINFDADWGLF